MDKARTVHDTKTLWGEDPDKRNPSSASICLNTNYLRMDGKRGHVTCGNRLAIERQESFQKFASFKEELLLYLGLLGSYNVLHGLFGIKMTPAQ